MSLIMIFLQIEISTLMVHVELWLETQVNVLVNTSMLRSIWVCWGTRMVAMMLLRMIMLNICFFEFDDILNDNFSFLHVIRSWNQIKIVLPLILFNNKFSSFLFISFYDLYKIVGLKMIWVNMLKEIVNLEKPFFESLSSNWIKKVSINECIFIVPNPFSAIECIILILFITSIKIWMLNIFWSIV